MVLQVGLSGALRLAQGTAVRRGIRGTTLRHGADVDGASVAPWVPLTCPLEIFG